MTWWYPFWILPTSGDIAASPLVNDRTKICHPRAGNQQCLPPENTHEDNRRKTARHGALLLREANRFIQIFRAIPVRKLLSRISLPCARRLQRGPTPASMICPRPSEDLSNFRGYHRGRVASYGRTSKSEHCPGWGLSRRRLLRRFARFLRSNPRSINSIRRETMLNIHHNESQPSRVTVAFEHSALSFTVSKDATLEDLADRLDRLGKRRHGKPVAIAVKLAAASDAHKRGTPDPT